MQIITSNKIKEFMSQNHSFADECKTALKRHKNKDWGMVDRQVVSDNNRALLGNGAVFSAYYTYYGKIWVITNSKTTYVLFPDEYKRNI